MLVVQEVCTGRYSAGRARAQSARGQERLVGRFGSGAAVGVAEEVAVIDCVWTSSKQDPSTSPIKPALTLPSTNDGIALLVA